MDVRDIVESIVRKYHTRNPYELADYLHIYVSRYDLKEIRGYYLNAYRVKQIWLNYNLSKHDEQFVLAHEIGHSVLHPNVNTLFLRSHTLLSIDKMEIEADTFAANLLIPDEIILENWSYTTEQLSRLLGYDKYLIELRMKSYHDI